MSGQKDGQQARIFQTARWLNATPVDAVGQPLPLPPDEEERQFADIEITLAHIRAMAAKGVVTRICENNPPLIEQLRDALSPEELQYVTFDVDGASG